MIVTFYSYKGGVGRTQLIANIASYLCFHKKKNVLLIDWDLEAPGLHTFFNYKPLNIEKGLIDLFIEYVKMAENERQIEEKDLPTINENNGYINTIALNEQYSKEIGKIDLIYAGNYNKNYSSKINNFNWFKFYELLDGKTYVEFLKSELNKLIRQLGQIEKKERNKILIEIRDLINDHDPELIDRNVMDFPLSSKRRWYDKDPIAWMTINGLMFAENAIIEQAVSILASKVPN